MPINIIPVNGNSSLIDYDELKSSFENFLGNRCTEATMYVFNRFDAPVSTEASIDLLFFISLKEIRGNYTRFPAIEPERQFDYFYNLVLPVSVLAQHENSVITAEGNHLLIDDVEYDITEESNSLKFGFLNFLEKKCGIDKTKLFIEPVKFIINNGAEYCLENFLVNKRFKGEQLFELLKSRPAKFFKSYSLWNGESGYEIFKNTAERINEAIAEISEYGFLTKRKIERIASQLVRDSAMYDSIGEQTTSINGKAGTGKTAHLLHLSIRNLKNGQNVTFLTYNHLLTKDLAYQVKMAQNALYKRWELEGLDSSHFTNATVQTLMGFIFRLSRSLGVLALMTKSRVEELETVLRSSIDFLVANLPALVKANANKVFANNDNNYEAAIECIQNTNWEVSKKQYGILFVKYLKRNLHGLTLRLPEFGHNFIEYKMIQLREMSTKGVFIKDYPGCLKNTLDAIRETKKFYDQYDVKNQFSLLDVLMDLSTRKGDEDLKKGLISFELFEKRIKNVIKGRTTRSRILMIDEAQDCHSYEREIFYEIFKPENVVISNGGNEQLIRFAQLCNWEIFNTKKIEIKKIPSGNKSYRIKQSILDFCNFIAVQHNIDLNLKSFSEEDTGHIIFDFRSQEKIQHNELFSDFLERGAVNGCSALESVMILDVNKQKEQAGNRGQESSAGFVNEFNVLDDKSVENDVEFLYLDELSQIAEYWVGAGSNKQELGFPSPNEVRIINYESCRGLEAWCVVCFNIDSFYHAQKKSSDAEKYLLHEGLVLSSDARAAMFAITWILMAATRAIDTLYFQMTHLENDLSILCLEYANSNPDKCTIYKN